MTRKMSYPYDGESTLDNFYFTYTFDKISCISFMYYLHVTFSYLVFIVGLLAIVSRFFIATRWLHVWFGRLYIVFMIWTMATSLLINNEGLPPAVLISFLWVLIGLTFGWFVILIGKHVVEDVRVPRHMNPNIPLSYKITHGVLMFISWFNIAGRAFFPGSGNFQCYTYPIYKTNLTALPLHDPNFLNSIFSVGLLEWGSILLFVPLFIFLFVYSIKIFVLNKWLD